ncbi:MAG: hypothetical protein Q8S20_08705 [Sulfuritalea sp.]|nr:hypothetical protein [Sulfuritalea sp.]
MAIDPAAQVAKCALLDPLVQDLKLVPCNHAAGAGSRQKVPHFLDTNPGRLQVQVDRSVRQPCRKGIEA